MGKVRQCATVSEQGERCKAKGAPPEVRMVKGDDGKQRARCIDHAGRSAAEANIEGKRKGGQTDRKGKASAALKAEVARIAWTAVTASMLARWRAGASARFSDLESIDRATDAALDGFVADVANRALKADPEAPLEAAKAIIADPEAVALIANRAGRAGDGRTEAERSREVAIGKGAPEGADLARQTDPEAVAIDREAVARVVAILRTADDAAALTHATGRALRRSSPDVVALFAEALAEAVAIDAEAIDYVRAILAS